MKIVNYSTLTKRQKSPDKSIHTISLTRLMFKFSTKTMIKDPIKIEAIIIPLKEDSITWMNEENLFTNLSQQRAKTYCFLIFLIIFC